MSDFWIKVDKTLRHHAHQSVVTARAAWWDLRKPRAERPLFIVSGSRSGTQMLYKTLTKAPELGSLDREIYAVWWKLHPPAAKHWDTHALGAEDASPADRDFITRYFYSHTGKLRFLDKNNQHGLAVPYLHALFPDADFIYLKRNPGDTLNSMIEGWGKPERFATWSDALPEKVAVENGLYTRWCFFLADGWRNYLNASVEDVCAFQYRSIHQAILTAKPNIPPNQWHEVFYEDIVRDPAGTIADLSRTLGLSFEGEFKSQAEKVLNRPYEALFEIRLDKWRDHAHRARIEKVLPALTGLAREMGYAF